MLHAIHSLWHFQPHVPFEFTVTLTSVSKTSIFTTRQRTAHDGFVRSERRPVEFGRRTCTMSIQQELFL